MNILTPSLSGGMIMVLKAFALFFFCFFSRA